MPRRIGQEWPTLLASTLVRHLTGGRDGVCGLERVVDRRPEDGEQAVAEELVHNAVVTIDDFDQNLEDVVKALDDFGRRSGARRCGEAADVDEHHANAPHLAEFGRADCEQTVDDARRDMLTKRLVSSSRAEAAASARRKWLLIVAPA